MMTTIDGKIVFYIERYPDIDAAGDEYDKLPFTQSQDFWQNNISNRSIS